jgi:putative flippase GtrA
MLKKINNLLLNYKTLSRWALVGTITFMIDYLVFISVYALVESVILANSYAGLLSISFNYLAHYSWSFKSESNHSNSSIKYLINLIIFWGIGTLLLKILIDVGIQAEYAKLIPVPIISPLSFLSLKFIVFNKLKSDN